MKKNMFAMISTIAPNIAMNALNKRHTASVADDAAIPNGNGMIAPKTGTAFAAEDFGVIPVGMNSYGDYEGPSSTSIPASNNGSVIQAKLGSKFAFTYANETSAYEEEDACDACLEPLVPAGQAEPPQDMHAGNAAPSREPGRNSTASVPDSTTIPNDYMITAKPGSKFAAKGGEIPHTIVTAYACRHML